MMEALVGMDVGGTNTRAALVSREGEIIARTRAATSRDGSFERFLEGCLSLIGELREAGSRMGYETTGIGIGIPGLVSSDGLVRAAVNLRHLEGNSLGSRIGAVTGIPVVCGNDANLIALGEARYGAGRPFRSFAALTIGTGLGSGLILDGRLWTGTGGYAAEFGHTTLVPEGLPCPCGNRGCLEQYVSAPALCRLAEEEFQKESLPVPERIDAETVACLAREGSVPAAGAFRRMSEYLGSAIASLANTLNLDAVVVGGGVSSSFDLMEQDLRRTVSAMAFSQIASALSIVAGSLGDDAGLLGAAAVSAEQAHTHMQENVYKSESGGII